MNIHRLCSCISAPWFFACLVTTPVSACNLRPIAVINDSNTPYIQIIEDVGEPTRV